MSLISKKIWQGFRRGLFHRCPNCNARSIYQSYLKVKDKCDECGLSLHEYPSDDTPPYISISLVSTIIVPLVFIHAIYWDMPNLVLFLIWIPITICFVLVSLPPIKGSVIGILWALNIKRR